MRFLPVSDHHCPCHRRNRHVADKLETDLGFVNKVSMVLAVSLRSRPLLGGSWVVISRVISRDIILITYIRGLITLLITTHEPPSTQTLSPEHSALAIVFSARWLLLGVLRFGVCHQWCVSLCVFLLSCS